MGEMRRAIAREEQERAKVMEEQKANDRPVCFDTGNRRVDNCCRATRERAGHQQTVASFDVNYRGQHRACKDDPGEGCALGWCESGGRYKL
jgi:hypothetical protein